MDRIRGLDAIRWVCAVWVVFSHLGVFPLMAGCDISNALIRNLQTAYQLVFVGPPAVICFFVISGFCIHFPNSLRGMIRHHGEYFLRRYLRIGAPLAVVLAFYALSGLETTFIERIMWSLYAEIIYYTLYPILLVLARRWGWKTIIWASSIIALGIVLTDPWVKSYQSYGIVLTSFLGLPCWLLGCLLAEWVRQSAPQPVKGLWLWRGGMVLAVWVCGLLWFKTPLGYPLTLNFLAVAMTLWLFREIQHFRVAEPIGLIEWSGKWSYSLYIVHVPASQLLEPSFNWSQFGHVLAWLLFMGTIFLCSIIFYAIVELPSHQLARYLGARLTGDSKRVRASDANGSPAAA